VCMCVMCGVCVYVCVCVVCVCVWGVCVCGVCVCVCVCVCGVCVSVFYADIQGLKACCRSDYFLLLCVCDYLQSYNCF